MTHPVFRREVYSIFITQLFSLYSLSTFNAYVGIKLDNLAATALVIGIVFASRNIVQIFLRIPFSEMSQILGRKPMILGGSFCYATALGLLYLATGWQLVLIATLLLGTGMSMHWPAVFSYIGDISENDYGRINGIIFQGQDIGIIIGSLSASYLLSQVGINLDQLFLISWVAGTIGILLSVFILPEVLEDKNRNQVDSVPRYLVGSFVNILRSIGRLTRQYPLGIVFILELLITFTEFFLTSFFPLLVVIALGYSESQVADLVLISTVALIFFKPMFGAIFDKFGFRWPILVSLLLTSIFFYMMTILQDFVLLAIVYTLTVAAFYICFIASSGGTNNSTDPKQRGLAMGVLGVYISSGRALSSILLAPLLGVFETDLGSRAEGLIQLFEFTAFLVFVIVILLGIITQILKIRNERVQ